MKWLVALALAVLVGTAVSTNIVNATRPATVTTVVTTAGMPPSSPNPTTVAPSPPDGSAPASAPTASAPTAPVSPDPPTASPPAGIAVVELAAHATEADCWLAVDGQVYDVSAYLNDHPGGSRTIIPWCGHEATTAFATEDGRGEHSADAYALLADYRLGALAPA